MGRVSRIRNGSFRFHHKPGGTGIGLALAGKSLRLTGHADLQNLRGQKGCEAGSRLPGKPPNPF